MPNKKIFFFLPTLRDGGGERVVSELTRAFSDGIECTIVLFEDRIEYPYKGNIISLGVPLAGNYFYRLYAFFIRLARFKKIIKAQKPDHVISLGDSPNIINTLSHKNSIVRVDMFLSKEYHGFFGVLFKILIKFCFNRSPKIITVSRASAYDLIHNFDVKQEKITNIYNPIDLENIQQLSKETLEPQYQEIFKNPVIINAGRQTYQKGQWHLIRAFSEAKKEIKDLKLVILGTGELEPYFKKLICDYHLEHDVFLLGWQKNPFKFINKSALFVSSSLWDGLPMVLIESMASGVPVIATDARSGAREILAPDTDFNLEARAIEYAKCGVLTPVCDGNFYKAQDLPTKEENILGEAMVKVLGDKVLREALIKASKERAQYFDIKNIIKEWDFLKN